MPQQTCVDCAKYTKGLLKGGDQNQHNYIYNMPVSYQLMAAFLYTIYNTEVNTTESQQHPK